ncbi:RNA methyltransferase [Chloroflexi bacterium TSY]|nr:RNA methyltransferase [Chloroflexi bacterium TSY]
MAGPTKNPSNHGHFGIGIYQVKRADNVGMLWRGAYQLGAAYIFTVGQRYKPQPSDPFKTWQHIPLFSYESIEQMLDSAAYGCPLVGIESGGALLPFFDHPEQGIYLLGAEDSGLPKHVLSCCHQIVSIPAIRADSYNVAQAGTLVMYDRMIKNSIDKNLKPDWV